MARGRRDQMAANFFLSPLFLLLCFFIVRSIFLHPLSNSSVTTNSRKAIEIIIGGGGEALPPPQPQISPLPPLLPRPQISPLPPPMPQISPLPPLPSPPQISPLPPLPPQISPLPPPAPQISPLPPLPPQISPLPPPTPPPQISPPSPTPTPAIPPPEGPSSINNLPTVLRGIRTLAGTIKYDPKGFTKTWKGNNPCKFKGFFCDPLPTNNKIKGVSGVDFNGNRFGGSGQRGELLIEGFIETQSDIAIFHANSNNFTGGISPKLAMFRYLYELDLSNNRFEGPFPASVLNIKTLTFLDLRYNMLTGPLPPQVFNLDLDVLFLNNNQFDQNIPSNFGNTPALYLTFANNKFTGEIPASIGRASKTLVEVLFLNNQLSGCLPYQIGLLKTATLFDASMNKLTGPIPLSFGCLARIKQLILGNNQLYGTVPESVCKLPRLFNLSLPSNYFTEVGPACRKLIYEKKLDVKNNCIRDLPNQRPPVECAAFFSNSKYCRDQRMLCFIPCDANSMPQETSDREANPAPAPSPAYAALVRPHL